MHIGAYFQLNVTGDKQSHTFIDPSVVSNVVML